MRRHLVFMSSSLLLVMSACITVNIYFPAPEVRQAAEQIVEETWGAGGPGDSGAAATPGETSLMSFLVAAAEAQEIDIEVSTAAIRALKDAMRGRASQLKPHLAKGRVGVGSDGLLTIRNLEGVPLGEQATIRRLVDAENRDRTTLYREIAEANSFGEDRVDDIAAIFADTWIEKSESGWWVQDKGGGWRQR